MHLRSKIWYRYIQKRFLSHIIVLTFLCFFLFVFADLLVHIKDVFAPATRWKTWIIYYACMFSYRMDILIPFAIALTTSILLPKLVRNNELIPLLNAGLSLKSVLFPCISIAIVCTGILLINYQFIYPRTTRRFQTILQSDFGQKKTHSAIQQIGMVLSNEGSRLFFAQHNTKKHCITDLFWVRSPDCIFHIEQLYYYPNRPVQAYGIDVIERDSQGKMRKTASYEESELPELCVYAQELKTAYADPRELSITQLAYLLPRFGSSISEKAIETGITLYQKLLFPLLAILAFIFPAPACLRFERRIHQCLLIFLSFAGLFGYMILIQFFVVLTRAPICLPLLTLSLPWLLGFLFAFRNCQKLQ